MTKNDPAPALKKFNLVVSRVFDAPIGLVWKAWTDPQLVMQWWGPDRFISPSAVLDFREGGKSLVCMRAPAEMGGQDMYSTWTYRKIEPMQRIELIHNLADKDGNKVHPSTMGMPPDFPIDLLMVVKFKDLGEGRTEMTVTEHDWTPGHMSDLAKTGLEQSLDKMAKALAGT